MAIRLHFHDRSERTAPVSPTEANGLIRCFGSAASGDQALWATAESFLEALRNRHQWLACSCREDAGEAGVVPLLSPRRLTTGEITLVRHSLAGHHAACPFHVPEEDRHLGQGAGPAAPRRVTPWTKGWLLLRPDATSENAEDTASGEPSRPRPGPTIRHPVAPALERLHRTLLERMGFHALPIEDVLGRHAASAYDRFRAIDAESVAGAITWGEIACRFPGSLVRHCMALRRRATDFPAGTRPQGYFIGIVDAIDGDAAHGWRLKWSHSKGQGEITVAGDVVGSPLEEGPFHALVSLASTHADPLVQPRSACLLPCYSRSVLMPVESDLERHALHWLAGIAREAKRLPSGLQVKRSLFPTGELEPTFTLAWESRQALVFIGDGDGATERDRESVARSRQALASFVFQPDGENDAATRRLHALLGREASSNASTR